MSSIFESIQARAQHKPESLAIMGNASALSYAQLLDEVNTLRKKIDGDCIGIFLENSPAWAIADIALFAGNKTCVPLPGFFSNLQIDHIIEDAGIQQIITDKPERLHNIRGQLSKESITIANQSLSLVTLDQKTQPIASDICKVTYTSGSSGTPKGVCLSKQSIERVTESLRAATNASSQDICLALLPLSTLLENIGSVYIPLTAGACCTLVPSDDLGIYGSSLVSVTDLMEVIAQSRPTSLILTPRLLNLLVTVEALNPCLPDSLRFIAVGGAVVSTSLLERAASLGLPVYQGYGLSEAASVVSLNTETDNKIGSVGKVLAPNTLRIDDQGEIHLRGNLFKGYLHDRNSGAHKEWATGDLGYMDEQGYLFINGRKRNVFITANGRNVSPEWIEEELTQHSPILQAAVFGESRPFNVAFLVCDDGVTSEKIQEIVTLTNEHMPDYARVEVFVLAESAFTVENGELNTAGVLDRQQIYAHYEKVIDEIYKEKKAI